MPTNMIRVRRQDDSTIVDLQLTSKFVISNVRTLDIPTNHPALGSIVSFVTESWLRGDSAQDIEATVQRDIANPRPQHQFD